MTPGKYLNCAEFVGQCHHEFGACFDDCCHAGAFDVDCFVGDFDVDCFSIIAYFI